MKHLSFHRLFFVALFASCTTEVVANSTISLEVTNSELFSVSVTPSLLTTAGLTEFNSSLTWVMKNITIITQDDYVSIVGDRKDELVAGIRTNITEIFNLPKQPIIDIEGKSGNISINISLEVPASIILEISERLKNGSLVIYGLNGMKLNIPPQADGKILANDTKNLTTIIIGVTAASLGATFLLILWIIWNSKNNKAVKPHGTQFDGEGLNIFNLHESNEAQAYQQREADVETTFGGINEARVQVQWDIFQKSFNKPSYVWRNQEAVWAGVDYKVNWQLDPSVKAIRNDVVQEPDRESKRI